MTSEVFFDTNILLYAVDGSDHRHDTASALIAQGGTIGVQGLNEFAAVARRKFGWAWDDISRALGLLRRLCRPPCVLDAKTHDRALTLAARDGFNIYDSLMLAAAMQAGCTVFLSEDMQDGRLVDGRLTIRNPFAA